MKTLLFIFSLEIILGLVPALAQPSSQVPPPTGAFPLPAGVQAWRDLEYGRVKDRAMLLDLYTPSKSDKPAPLIIWVHGGAWMAGSKNDRCPADSLTLEGFAVAHVGYRFSQEATFPAQIHDCKAAVRWLRANASKYNIDPNRFVAWGSSAGGHLVALLGVTSGADNLDGTVNNLTESSRVQGVIDWFGPSDFLQIGVPESDIRHNAPDSPESKLIGGSLLENKDKAARASPVTYVTRDDCPFLIMHGDKDRTVPFNQSELLEAALKKAGVEVTFVPMKDAGHGFGGPLAIEPVKKFLARFKPAAQ